MGRHVIEKRTLFIGKQVYRQNDPVGRLHLPCTGGASIFAAKIFRTKKDMNVKRTFGIWLACACVLSSCISDDDSYTQGVWTVKSNLDGPARGHACYFTIGNKGYLCCGYGYNKNLKDMWIYDIDGNYWEQGADMPGTERHDAVGFTVNGKGYITTGANRTTGDYMKDTWQYDPDTDTWTQMDDYPSAVIGAFSFTLGNYAYVGGGKDEDNYLKDIYRFDPTAAAGSQWTKVVGYPGNKRIYATTFVIDNVAYLCCGSNNGTNVDDFWKFDGTTWTQLRDISDSSDYDYDDDYDIVRNQAVAFVIDGKAFVVGGTSAETSGSYYSDWWIYDPSTDLWEGEGDYEFTPFEGSSRTGCAAFSTGSRGFVVGGKSGSNEYDDMYELSPYELEDD